MGALAAVPLTLFLDLSALQEMQKFSRGQADKLGWNEASTERHLAASEEALMSLLGQEDEQQPEEAPRLVVVARPEPGKVELEFMAVFDETNLEDCLAHLEEEAEGREREEGEISLLLLRHYAASVRHQKYYGLDIVTVQVRGSR